MPYNIYDLFTRPMSFVQKLATIHAPFQSPAASINKCDPWGAIWQLSFCNYSNL